jgi:hypothetical protein
MSTYSFQALAEPAEIVQKLQPETLENMSICGGIIRARGGECCRIDGRRTVPGLRIASERANRDGSLTCVSGKDVV